MKQRLLEEKRKEHQMRNIRDEQKELEELKNLQLALDLQDEELEMEQIIEEIPLDHYSRSYPGYSASRGA